MSFVAPASKKQRRVRQRAISTNIDHDLFSQGRKNIALALKEADRTTKLEGLAWYDNAHVIASEMAVEYGMRTSQVAGVIAALSPQTGWKTNIDLAKSACVQAKTGQSISGHTGNACKKASKILDGIDPITVLGGRKVRSFYRNILNPNENGPVTIDRHMIDLMAGEVGSSSRILERIGAYTFAAACVRSVARDAQISGSQAQAIVWLWHRRKNNALGHRTDPAIKVTTPRFVSVAIS